MNGNSTISEINVDNISVNLTDSLSDVRNYEGFLKCNSPHVGGMLNNVWRSETVIPEGHEYITTYKGDVYTMIKNGSEYDILKNGAVVMTLPSGKVVQTIPHRYVYERDILGNKQVVVEYKGASGWKGLAAYPGGKYAYSIDENGDLIFTIGVASKEGTILATEVDSISISSAGVKTTGHLFPCGVEAPSVDNENRKHSMWDAISLVYEEELQSNPRPHVNVISAPLRGSRYSNTQSLYALVNPVKDYTTRGQKIIDKYDGYEESFAAIYYNKVLTAISYKGSVITYDVSEIIGREPGLIQIKDSKGQVIQYEIKKEEKPSFEIINNYIIFDCIGVKNSFNMDTGKEFCRSSDYNDYFYIELAPSYAGEIGAINIATGVNEQIQVNGGDGFASIYPPTTIAFPVDAETAIKNNSISISYNKGLSSSTEIGRVNVYLGSSGNPPTYKSSTPIPFDGDYFLKGYTDHMLEGMSFPLDVDGNILYNTPLDMKLKQTFSNYVIGKTDSGSYLLAQNNKKESILGWYLLSESEADEIFLLQSGFFALMGNFIFNIDIENSISSIGNCAGNKSDLLFLGAFPTMALFWSNLDKSIYAFSGDNSMRKMKESYRVNHIETVFCDPARLTLLIATDIGLVIVYQNQVFLVDDIILTPGDRIWYDSDAYHIGTKKISFSNIEGLTPYPVKFQTEFFGVGNMLKSVNDCVFLRVVDNGLQNGSVKVKSWTLTDKTTESTEQEWIIDSQFFDEPTGTRLLQYQPQHQSGMGFSIEVESTHPINYVAIGHSVEAVQQSVKVTAGVSAQPVTRSPSAIQFD